MPVMGAASTAASEPGSPMRLVVVPCLKDNYAYLVISASGEAAVVDASEAAPVRDALERAHIYPDGGGYYCLCSGAGEG